MQNVLRFIDRGLVPQCTVAAVVVAGIFGVIDGGIAGLVGSALVALFACGLFSFGIRSVINIGFDPRSKDENLDGDAKLPTTFERMFGIVGRLVGLVVLVVVLHDLYYVIEMTALGINHNTGAQITQATVRGDSREYLRDSLTPQRWQHAIVNSRPTRWLLTDEVAAMNQGTLKFIDFIKGKGIGKLERSSGWKETLKNEGITALFRSDNWFVKKLTDRLLNAYGNSLCETCHEKLKECQAKGWILKRLPKEWFQTRRGG